MPYDFPLSQALRQAGWKVKIHDFERLEPPHITVYRKKGSGGSRCVTAPFSTKVTSGAKSTKKFGKPCRLLGKD